jgi:predicted RND superfamily exporter protein
MSMIKGLVRVVRLVGELLILFAAIIAIAWAFGANTSIGANLCAE